MNFSTNLGTREGEKVKLQENPIFCAPLWKKILRIALIRQPKEIFFLHRGRISSSN